MIKKTHIWIILFILVVLSILFFIPRMPVILKGKFTDNLLQIKKPTQESISAILSTISQSPRYRGTDGDQASATYIFNFLTKEGYSPQYQPFDIYKQDLRAFADYFNLNPLKEDEPLWESQNIIAHKESSIETTDTLIICAHFDTTKGITGVLDNASGVTIVLEAARILKDIDLPFNVEFILFGGEEYYLSGSRHFVSELKEGQKENIIGCINIDVIGEASQEGILIGTADGTPNSLSLNMLNATTNPKLIQDMAIGQSDHLSFVEASIPSVHMSDLTINADLITTEHPIETVSTKRLTEITQLLIEMISHLDPVSVKEYSYKKEITQNEVAQFHNIESLVEFIPAEYNLVSITESLKKDGTSSQTIYLYEDSKGGSLEIVKYFEPKQINWGDKGYEKINTDTWIKHTQTNSHLITRLGKHTTELIGDNQVIENIKEGIVQDK